MTKNFYFEFSNKFKISNKYEAITKDLGSENYCILKHIRKEIKKQELKFEIDVIGKLHNLGFDTIFFNEVKAEINEKLEICFKQIIFALQKKKKKVNIISLINRLVNELYIYWLAIYLSELG